MQPELVTPTTMEVNINGVTTIFNMSIKMLPIKPQKINALLAEL